MILEITYKYWEKSKLFRFIIVGGTTVLIDMIFYFLLMYLGFETNFSKGTSFIIGTIFAYFANKKITFRTNLAGFWRFNAFFILYVCSLYINVTMNGYFINLFIFTKFTYILSFVFATLISATINFFGMKLLIFKK